MLQQLPKELQDLVSDLIEEAEFKGKQVTSPSIAAHVSSASCLLPADPCVRKLLMWSAVSAAYSAVVLPSKPD